MKRLAAVFLLIAVLLGSSGCGKKDPVQIAYDLSGQVLCLDPQIASSSAEMIILSNIGEGLFRLNEQGEPEPALAEKTDVSADRRIYRFSLRKDAFWETSKQEPSIPIQAQDFVFAFQRLLLPKTQSPAAEQFFSIKNAKEVYSGQLEASSLGVYAEGDYTLVIELEEPNERLLHLLATTYAQPCHEAFFQDAKGKYGLELSSVRASGGFVLSSWIPGSSARLAKNNQYHSVEEILPDRVILRTILPQSAGTASSSSEASSGAGSSLERLTEELVDAALVSGSDYAALKGKGFQSEPIENTVWGILLNQKNEALANANIRKALASAFDRRTYASGLPDYLLEANAMIPHSVMAFGRNFREYAGENRTAQFDAHRSYEYYKSGLAELGRNSVNDLSLLVNRDSGINGAEYFLHVSQILQKELSLYIRIDEVEEAEFRRRWKSGEFDLALVPIQASDLTPWSVLGSFQTGAANNAAGYGNPAFDSLLQTAVSSGEAEGLAAYDAAEQLLLEDAVFLPMYYSTDYFVTQPGTTGIVYHRQTGLVDFRRAWAEP